jgi:hypothetical protein
MNDNTPQRAGCGSMPLADLLRDAALGLGQVQPPAALRERIVARWQPDLPLRAGRHLSRPGRRRLQRVGWRVPRAWAWSGAAACALALLLSLLLAWPWPAPESGARADARLVATSGFVPLVGPERWRQLTADAATPAWLVTTELPRERLAAIGLPFDPARAAEPVRAELLMHASGDVIALRVIGQPVGGPR